jgi:hypothetical protein
MKFEEELVNNGRVQSLENLATLQIDRVQNIWRNKRSWRMAKSVASYLDELGRIKSLDDRGALRLWAVSSNLESWKQDPIGKTNGVGITTFQYLRMMGGIDTAMPDKIVRRVIRQILDEAGLDMPTEGDIELIKTIERLSEISGYRPIEICWMTWLIQPEGNMIRMEKYQSILNRI